MLSWNQLLNELRKYNRTEVISYVMTIIYDAVDQRDITARPLSKWDSLKFAMENIQSKFAENVSFKLASKQGYPLAPLHALSFSRLEIAQWAVAEIIREHRKVEESKEENQPELKSVTIPEWIERSRG